MRFSSLLLSLAIFLLNAEFCNTAKIRMCANHFCTEPVYKAVGKEDWENNTPGFINIFKGDEIVVFGVEGQYFDAEARGMRGFLPREKAEISETLLPPTVKFDPFYKEDGTNGSAEPASQSAEVKLVKLPNTNHTDSNYMLQTEGTTSVTIAKTSVTTETTQDDMDTDLQYDEEDIETEYDGLVFEKGELTNHKPQEATSLEVKDIVSKGEDNGAAMDETKRYEMEKKKQQDKLKKAQEFKHLQKMKQAEDHKKRQELKRQRYAEMNKRGTETKQDKVQRQEEQRAEEANALKRKLEDKQRAEEQRAEEALKRKLEDKQRAEEASQKLKEAEERQTLLEQVERAKHIEEEQKRLKDEEIQKMEKEKAEIDEEAAAEKKRAEFAAKKAKLEEQYRLKREKILEERRQQQRQAEMQHKDRGHVHPDSLEAHIDLQKNRNSLSQENPEFVDRFDKQNDGAAKSKATKTQEQPAIEQTTDSGIVAEKYHVVEEKPVLANEQPVVNNEQRATPVLPNSIAEQPSSQQPVEESETEKLAPAHPVVEEPVAKKEVLEEPVSEEQVAEQPVAEQPGAEQPGAEQPVVEKPVVEKSVVEQPVAEQPVVEQPVAEKSVAEKPVAEQPVAEKPVAEQPVVEKSVPEQPVAEQPVPEQPVADKSVAEKPVVEKPVTEDHTETQQNPPENVYQPEQTLTSDGTATHDPPMEESQHENQEDSGSSVVSTYKEEEDDLGFPEDFDINKITEEQTAPEIPEKVPEMPAETPDIPQNTPEIPADTTETHKDSTPLEPDDSELTKTERRQRRYQDVRQVSLPVYCKLPLVGGLCDSVGSDATVLILCTLTVPLILAVIFLFTSPGPGSPQKEAERVNTEVKPDPRVLETLENHGKTQQQLAGHIDDVSTQLTQLTQQINDHRLESVKFQEQLTKTQNKLNLSLEKNVLLERDNRTLNNKLAEQTRYNTGFADLEKSLKDQIQILEEKVDNRDNIIKTQEFTATSTSEQIATLQSQLEETIRDRDETLSSLNTANSNVEELTQELEMTQDKLDTTSELFEQAQSDTEAWTVRVQILSLELADTQSQLTSLEESLKEKESDLDILRECLVDMRSACQSETHFDFDSHFRDMIDVNNLKSENEKIHTNLKEMSEDLEEVTEARDLFEERIQEIEDEMEELKAQKEAETTKKIEYSTKLETLTTYFKDKEDNLHCRLSELQVKCKQLEEENSEVNILFYKEELSKLKKAHAETERNLTLQIQTNERKAKEAYSQLRSKDVKLKEKEEQLKKLKKGGKVVVHEDGPPIGPSFMDFPMIRKTRGDNPDSPCESLSSLTSAEDLEKRRKHAAEGPPPPLDYERQPYPPDFRPDYDGGFPPRPYNEGYMPPPRDLYRDFPPAGFDRDFLPPPRSLDLPRSRDSSRPPSVGGPILPPRDVPILSHRGGPDPYFPPRETTGSLPHLPPRDEKPLLPSRNSLPPRKTSTGANGQDMLGSKVNLNITDQNSNSFSLGV